MNKISVNLLPPELLSAQKKSSNMAKLNVIAIAALILTIITTTLILTVKIIQASRLQSEKNQLDSLNAELQTFESQDRLQAQLKSRIQQIFSIKTSNPGLVEKIDYSTKLIPSDFRLNHLSFDKNGNVLLSVESTGAAKLKGFFDSLTNPQNQGKISQVLLESLTRGKDDKYTYDLNLEIK